MGDSIKKVKEEVLETLVEKLPEKIEIILKENLADVIHPETPVRFTGILESAQTWLDKRVNLIDQKASYVVVNRDNLSIN